ncbi:uncharacterized protein VTP21DRAFT_9709 [Calcarisporiella thermophila]|uniref:uncharacterized protein n=1 Tax=Calcarisporiella thermophila TaxID=911321 RepID=UPI0037428FA4
MFFISLVTTLLCLLLVTSSDVQAQGNATEYNYNSEYDFVVVGGGTAGGLVAIQLAKAGFKTLLMEAGPDKINNNVTVPLFFPRADEDPTISFSYFPRVYAENSTQYQSKVFYPRVGALGGCSIHNAMNIVYPHKRDFDLLVNITGDLKFSEKYMREHYFKPMERNFYPLLATPEAHGKDGWFPTSYYDPLKLLDVASFDALRITDLQLYQVFLAYLGNPAHDINGYIGDTLGNSIEGRVISPMNVDPTTSKRGKFAEYIRETAQNLSNFDIWTDTLATRVILDDNNVARGVEYKQGKYLYKASPLSSDESRKKATTGAVKARREVIISAGAFNTPQLLMLSGIGDPEHLKSFNINARVNLPGVGKNLQDHYETSYIIKFPKMFNLLKGCKLRDSEDDHCYKQYSQKRSGPYTFNGILGATLRKSNEKLEEPDIFTYTLPAYFPKFYVGFAEDIAKNFDSVTRIILKAHAANPGEVRLVSADPFDMPYINFKYFEKNGAADLRDITKELKILRQESKVALALSGYKEIQPGPDVNTDEEIANFIRKFAFGHHACCTAKIGANSDSTAVLDGSFRVRGVNNLRVVDASAIPRIPGYFPVLYIHMLGLKAADSIIADNRSDKR